MAFSVVMPALEMAQETGKLVAWRKKEGESVTKGEVLLEIETDKAVMEIEAGANGTLAGVKAHEGAVVPVGQTIAWIVGPGEAAPTDAPPVAVPGLKSATASAPKATSAAVQPTQTSERAKVSPKARRLAKERGVDLDRLQGSGPGGEILAADILAVATGQTAAIAEKKVLKPSSIARLMAERTTQSWTSVPHFFLVRDVDAGPLNEIREKLKPIVQASNGIKLTHSDLLVALISRALAKHPQMNASWSAEGIISHSEVNVALAIAVEDGVVAPVIHGPNKAEIGEIAKQRSQLAGRAKTGKLRPSDLAGATFTISNLGMYGVDGFSAIITPPQAGILAVGRIADRVVPVNGEPGIRPMMTLTLSTDHRVAGGAQAAMFLNDVVEALGGPEEWLRA